MPEKLMIANTNVKPGQQVTIKVPVARLYTHTEMSMPVHVIRGKKAGPRLFVSATIHGDEIIGIEIIRRLLQLKKLRRLKGALIAIPVVNVYAFIHQSRYSPDRRDLNRFFPGSDKGSLTSRIADIFMDEIIVNCTHGIDLHAGSDHRINLPQIRADLNDPATRRLAMAFRPPLVIDASVRDGSLREAVAQKGIPILLYEGGEALRFDELAIRAGIRGILSVMEALEMLSKPRHPKPAIRPLIAQSTTWARAPISGILRTNIPLGSTVEKGGVIGKIADPFGEQDADVTATESGMVIGRLNKPLVHQGDAVFHIACLDRLQPVEPSLEEFQEAIGTEPFKSLK